MKSFRCKCGRLVNVEEEHLILTADAFGNPLCERCYDDARARLEVNPPPKPKPKAGKD